MAEPEVPERLLLPEEVADQLAVKVSWVYRAARERKLPSVRAGRWVRFRPSDVRDFIEKGGAAEV